MRQIILRAMVLTGFILLFGWMMFDLAYQVGKDRKTNRELAQAANLDLRYRLENAQQAERSKQIALIAEHEFTRSVVSVLDDPLSDDRNREGIVRVLREPYPEPSEVESAVGKADFHGSDANGIYLGWNQTTWEQPAGGTSTERKPEARRQKVVEILLARFDRSGKLMELVISAQDTPVKRIGRSRPSIRR